jgi:peptidoglycan/xylan/chitin deacetylase (PgdA/CDA1 family)
MRRLTFLVVLFLAATLSAQTPSGRRIAVTVDDLIFAPSADDLTRVKEGNTRFLDALKKHHAVATGFVTESKVLVANQVPQRSAVLDQWLDAGMELGNHNFDHVGLTNTSLAQNEVAVLKGEVLTKRVLAARGRTMRYYRYPMNETGTTEDTRDAFWAFLKAHGYTVAPVTMDNQDWQFNIVYLDFLRKKDEHQAKDLLDEYLKLTVARADFFDQLARQTFHRSIPQVMLIHINQLNAHHLDDVLTALEQHGYRFIPLDEALKDPAYQTPDGYVGPKGPSWIYRWRLGLKMSNDTVEKQEPAPVKWVINDYILLTSH